MKSLLNNLSFFIGISALIYGTWLIYRPAGYIVGGVLVAYISLALDKHESR